MSDKSPGVKLGVGPEFMPPHQRREWGKHEPDRSGLKWIELPCPNCECETRFNSRFNYATTGGHVDWGIATEYHSLVQCTKCDAIVYVKYHDVDLDPDWYIVYDFHYPTTKTEMDVMHGEEYAANMQRRPAGEGG